MATITKGLRVEVVGGDHAGRRGIVTGLYFERRGSPSSLWAGGGRYKVAGLTLDGGALLTVPVTNLRPAAPPPLRPCPFCGGAAAYGQCHADGEPWHFVNCTDCLASTNQLTGHAARPTREEAATAWNLRQPVFAPAHEEDLGPLEEPDEVVLF